MQLNFAGLNKVEVAIMRLKEFEPSEGYYLSFGGGKDSVVIYDLAIKSGVKFDAHYAITGIDPPELVYFIRNNYPDMIYDKPKTTIWKGIYIHGLPRRQSRWCCEELKECHGSERRVITGIRRAESARRHNRQMFEICRTDKTKYFLHPIIDWTPSRYAKPKTGDVWEYIFANNLPYCKLYNDGFKRLGCVLCPMETPRQTSVELLRFPKIAEAWKRACYRYWEKQGEGVQRWSTPEAFWQWWLSRKGEPKVDDAQCIMFDN